MLTEIVGAFIAPFTHAGVGQGKKWNFELPRVKSINVSGHKFGLGEDLITGRLEEIHMSNASQCTPVLVGSSGAMSLTYQST
jgi:hypothetical protein